MTSVTLICCRHKKCVSPTPCVLIICSNHTDDDVLQEFEALNRSHRERGALPGGGARNILIVEFGYMYSSTNGSKVAQTGVKLWGMPREVCQPHRLSPVDIEFHSKRLCVIPSRCCIIVVEGLCSNRCLACYYSICFDTAVLLVLSALFLYITLRQEAKKCHKQGEGNPHHVARSGRSVLVLLGVASF